MTTQEKSQGASAAVIGRSSRAKTSRIHIPRSMQPPAQPATAQELTAVEAMREQFVKNWVAIVIALITIVALPCIGWFSSTQAWKTYVETQFEDRGKRGEETRAMVVELRKDFNAEQKTNATFQGQMMERTTSMLQMLQNERDDRKSQKSGN